jgi:phage baseplate assembly protein W
MAVTRADVVLKARGQREDFSDFLDSFAKTPFGNQLGRVSNEQSVNQSIRNLVSTSLGERLFQPLVGCSVNDSLFELNYDVQASTLEFLIKTTLTNNEPRANVISVKVLPSINENALSINIIYSLINNSDPQTLTFTLKRVR